MKHLSILLVIVFAINYNLSYAQIYSSKAEKDKKETCIKFTKDLITDLQLNENEYIKIKSLNLLYVSKVAESNSIAQSVSTGSLNQLHELEKQHEHDLLLFLSPNQLQAYNVYIEQNKSVLRQLVEIIASKEILATNSNTQK